MIDPIILRSDDGEEVIVKAKDLPPSFTGRSLTFKSPIDALLDGAIMDELADKPPGPKSQEHFVKVRLRDIYGGVPKTAPTKRIPDYPHKCAVCGGRMLILFTSQEHEGGVCPGPQKLKTGRLR